jgi:ferrous iron transport protein A
MLENHPTLADLAGKARGTSTRVRGLSGGGAVVARLEEMGFTPGSTVRLVAQAPFGGPLAFDLRGARIALRRVDAACVEVVS